MKLTYKKIVNKKFETVINGYSPTQVDIYLDLVCSDYIEYGETITPLNVEIDALKKEINALKKELKSKEKEINSKIPTPNIEKTPKVDPATPKAVTVKPKADLAKPKSKKGIFSLFTLILSSKLKMCGDVNKPTLFLSLTRLSFKYFETLPLPLVPTT